MGRVLARTWVATALFALSMGVVAAKVLGDPWTTITVATALLVVPTLWWRLVGRHEHPAIRRGVLAGALTGACVHLLAMLGFLLWAQGRNGIGHDGFAALGTALFLVLGLGGAGLGAAIGAVLGAIIVGVGLQRSRNV